MITRVKRSIVWKMKDDDFINMVKKSTSVGDICHTLGSRKGGCMFSNIQRRIDEMKLNTNHFIDKRNGKYNFNYISKDEIINRLKPNTILDQHWLKKKLIHFSIIPHKCNDCLLTSVWNGKPITLHLDHIDGDHTNNDVSNLRFLCPNCHSQTSTFSMGTRKRKIHICIDCNKPTSGYGLRCLSCASKTRENKMVGNNGIEPLN